MGAVITRAAPPKLHVLALRRRHAGVQKLGQGGDELGWRERLGQKNAVGNATRCPFASAGPGHIDDGKFRVDLSGVLGDFPAVHPAAEMDVGYNCPVAGLVSLQKGHRFFA